MIVRIPTPAEDAAAEWLLAHERDLTTEESRDFDRWLAENDRNADAWARACLVWTEFDRDPDPLLAAMASSARTLRRPVWQSLPFRGAALAASILACFAIAFQLAGAPSFGPTERTVAVALAPIRYASTTRKSVMLPDGTRVVLDARSQMTFSQTGTSRTVTLLEGQAFFNVAHDATKPFSVTAAATTVTATGTEFSVSRAADLTDVILTQGSVTVASSTDDQVVRLVPGQRYRAFRGSVGRVDRVDVADALAWRSGFIVFRNVTITEAVETMNRYSDTMVRVGDAKAGSLRVTGQFKADPLRFAGALSEVYPVALRRNSAGVVEIVSTRSGRPQ